MRIRFKIEKGDIGFVSPYGLIGFVRGLSKAGEIIVDSNIEEDTTETHYIVDIESDGNFEMIKGQAESYGVKVVKMDKLGNEIP